MRVKVSYATNVGKLRFRNEDALLVKGKVISGVSMEEPEVEELQIDDWVIFAVADGMGGLPCGDVASRLTLEFLSRKSAKSSQEIVDLLKEAKRYLDLFVEEEGRCYGMGTAVAGISTDGRKVIVFNVGDCRVYSIGNGIRRLTRDHTEAFELYEKGLIREDEIRNHPLRNVLTSAIIGGYAEDFKTFTLETEIRSGDTFLICSDGLWDELSEDEIEACLRMKNGGWYLLKGALEEGKDNVSYILIRAL